MPYRRSDERETRALLERLRALPRETEWVEFKEAKTSFDFNRLGKYFSALSNEANLKNQPSGWLVFGISDKTHAIVGTQYRIRGVELEQLKHEIAEKTGNRLTVSDIHELRLPEGRVLLFRVPATPAGIPTGWEGHYYGREGESLGALSISELEQIRGQVLSDWSAEACGRATPDDLAPEAIAKARAEYARKHPRLAGESSRWSAVTFLNKTRLAADGIPTRAAVILLGKPESERHLETGIAQITWLVQDEHGKDLDYEHFHPPLLLTTDEVLAKIRNLRYRYLPDATLFPVEIPQYEPYVLREALHNCIAHQDYRLRSRIIVRERPEELLFVNAGSFLPGTVERAIELDAPQRYYRNQLLATAMVSLNMIDAIGSGIRKMFLKQRERNFPLPNYELKPNEVAVRIAGRIIDEKYTRLLARRADLTLPVVMLLDKVQKHIRLERKEGAVLRREKLIEGRYPNLFIGSGVAAVVGQATQYIRNRAFDKEHYKKMILAFLREYGQATRQDINALLMDKLSDVLNQKQKFNKIMNLLTEMRSKDRTIRNTGSDRHPIWKSCAGG